MTVPLFECRPAKGLVYLETLEPEARFTLNIGKEKRTGTLIYKSFACAMVRWDGQRVTKIPAHTVRGVVVPEREAVSQNNPVAIALHTEVRPL